MKVKKGDKVVIIAGNDKGKTGEIIKSYPKTNKVIVEGVQIRTKHIKPSKNSEGKIVKLPSPIDASNVMFYHEGSGTRLGKQILKDGSKVRFMKKFKETI